MRAALTLLAVVALVSFPAAPPVHAQTIKGFVRDDATGQPIADASIVLIDSKGKIRLGRLSEPNGYYELPLPEPGKYSLRVGAAGYEARDLPPVECKAGQILEIDIPIWTPGAPGGLRGFNERQEKGEGVFITRQDLDEYGASRFTDVMRNISAVDVIPLPDKSIDRSVNPGAAGRYATVRITGGNFRTDRLAGLQQRADNVERTGDPDTDCPPVLWLDGKWWGSIDEVNAAGPDGLLLPNDIQAIEIYNHPSVLPERFDSGNDSLCGVIVVWTRKAP